MTFKACVHYFFIFSAIDSLFNIKKNVFYFIKKAFSRGVLCKKVFLGILKNSQENTCQSLFFNKVAGLTFSYRTPLVAASVTNKVVNYFYMKVLHCVKSVQIRTTKISVFGHFSNEGFKDLVSHTQQKECVAYWTLIF